MANIKIFQLHLEDGVEFPKWVFRDWETARPIFDAGAYEFVYEYEEPSGDLEAVFDKFNTVYAPGYEGRSLSVSDIIVRDGTAFYVDSLGFAEIPDEMVSELMKE